MLSGAMIARAFAAMQFYDVLLVNPLIDGMNHPVAKGGLVVNQRNTRHECSAH
jgi:hypothetical protein